MRAYVRQVFCFPLDKTFDDLRALYKRIRDGLSLASTHLPHFAGTLRVSSDPAGRAFLSTSADDTVSLKMFDHREDASFYWTYPKLKASGFPCKAFVGPLFSLPYELQEDGPAVPVTEVHARIIHGGLLLCFYMHHSVSDGIGMYAFVSTFAGYTFPNEGRASGKGTTARLDADVDIDIPSSSTAKLVRDSAFEQLLQRCPEYVALDEPTGPTASPCIRHGNLPPLCDVAKTGRIFKFGPDKIAKLKSIARAWASITLATSRPSTFACLAAVTWSFCTVSRIVSRPVSTRNPSRLLIPVSWRRRAFQSQLAGYASNAVCIAQASTDVRHHLAASTTEAPFSRRMIQEATLGKLICLIDESINRVDDDFVRLRTALFRAAPDPRYVGINVDPQDPLHFVVNSWRHLGGDIEFSLPGMMEPKMPEVDGGRRTADAVRRAQPEWNMGAGLILPGKENADYEILVTLDEASMANLLANAGWNSWVSETVE